MSKSIGKISGAASYITTEDQTNNFQNFDKNTAKIVPFTQHDGNIGYHLVDKNGFVVTVTGNNDYTRNLWEQQNQQSLQPYDNYMEGKDRIDQLRNGNNLFLDIENNPNARSDMPWYALSSIGDFYINNYSDVIEKYAQQYSVDPDLVKAIMYNEGATGHWGGGNYVRDALGLSESQMPMNIRGDTWENFDGQHYDTYNPEQNIELGVQLIKRLQNSIHNPTIEKIATLYNRTGAMQVNDYGARTKTIYDQKPWLKKR